MPCPYILLTNNKPGEPATGGSSLHLSFHNRRGVRQYAPTPKSLNRLDKKTLFFVLRLSFHVLLLTFCLYVLLLLGQLILFLEIFLIAHGLIPVAAQVREYIGKIAGLDISY
jgi:hypothetical protein